MDLLLLYRKRNDNEMNKCMKYQTASCSAKKSISDKFNEYVENVLCMAMDIKELAIIFFENHS